MLTVWAIGLAVWAIWLSMEIMNMYPEHRVRESSALPAVLRVPGRAAQIGLAVCPPGW